MIPDALRIPDEIAEVLVDARAHGDHRIHDACAWLRANNPLGYATPKRFRPFWAVTRQADLKAVALAHDLFHSGDDPIVLVDREQEQRQRELTGDRPSLNRTVAEMDEPDHTKYRNVLAAFFRPDNIRKLEAHVRVIAREMVDLMLAHGGQCDFARDIAYMYPLHAFMELMGVPREDEPLILRLAQEFTSVTDSDLARDRAASAGVAAANVSASVANDFNAYFDRHVAERRKAPQDDLLTVLATATVDGALLPDRERRSYCSLLAISSHETTAFAISGGLCALAQNPAEFAKVKADPSLIPALVDEAVRWTSPSKHNMRTATRDVDLCERHFAKGDSVALFWVSGNRDETVIDDPFTFRVDRRPSKMVGFGWGAHNCLGQHLSRMEARILYEELLPRLDQVELAGEPRNVTSLNISGPKSVPVRYRMH